MKLRVGTPDDITRELLSTFRCTVPPHPHWEVAVQDEINNDLFRLCFERELSRDPRLLIFEGDQVVAALAAHLQDVTRPWVRHISLIAVAAEHRQHGAHLGREVLLETLDHCRGLNSRAATWLVDPRNLPSHKASRWVGGEVVFDPGMDDADKWSDDPAVAHLVRYEFRFPVVL